MRPLRKKVFWPLAAAAAVEGEEEEGEEGEEEEGVEGVEGGGVTRWATGTRPTIQVFMSTPADSSRILCAACVVGFVSTLLFFVKEEKKKKKGKRKRRGRRRGRKASTW